jgi:hypothetical protein
MPATVSFKNQALALAEAIRIAATPTADGQHMVYPGLDRDVLAALKEAFERGREYQRQLRGVT